MALETGTYISDLVSTNPASTDGLSQADDHLRLIKSTVKATFPNLTGAVTPTHTELNFVDGVTSAIQTQLDTKAPLASPTFTTGINIDNVDTTITRASSGVLAVEGGVVPLENRANTFSATQTINNSSPAIITLTSSTANGGYIELFTDNGTTRSYIGSHKGTYGTGNTTDLAIYNPNNITLGTGFVERVRIDASGNVGIGKTPTSKLDVEGTVRATGAVSPSSGAGMEMLYGSSTGFLVAYDRTAASFKDIDIQGANVRVTAGGTQRLVVDTSGNVGIGTTSANGKLDVNGGNVYNTTTATGSTGFYTYNGTNIGLSLTYDFNASNAYNDFRTKLIWRDSAAGFAERMRIDGSGNVGIGGSPSAKLHVIEGDAIVGRSAGIAQINATSGSVNVLLAANSGGVGVAGTGTNHPLWLATNNTQRAILGTDGSFVLTSSGGLGYGTGSGGTVTQITSKATGVTINKTNGQIITHNASLGAASEVSFTVTNSTVAATDNIILTKVSGGTATRYQLYVGAVAAGSFVVSIRNVDSTAQSDVITFNFAVIKSVTS